jgi:hypothetical protein
MASGLVSPATNREAALLATLHLEIIRCAQVALERVTKNDRSMLGSWKEF